VLLKVPNVIKVDPLPYDPDTHSPTLPHSFAPSLTHLTGPGPGRWCCSRCPT
jgi:hypothetical protein